jgi:hypothetical protein
VVVLWLKFAILLKKKGPKQNDEGNFFKKI